MSVIDFGRQGTLFQDYSESSAFIESWWFYEDFTVVDFIDYAFSESKSEAPSAFFGGDSRVEDILLHWTRYAFAGVGNINVDYVFLFYDVNGYRTFTIHCIYGVFAEVFYDPLKQLGA